NNTEKLATALKSAKSRKQLTILASTLSLKQAQKTLPLDDVDILIIKAKYERYSEPQQINNMLVLQPGSRGMRIGKLNLTVTKQGKFTTWKHEVIALPPETGDAPRMADWYAQYNAKVKEDYEKRVEVRKVLESGTSPFAGETACKNCHAKQHEIWFKTRHAEAFYALQDSNKAFDPDCIVCHTVGFEKTGGFIDPAITESLMHVQCENCHGAARKHAESDGKIPVTNKDWPNEKMCTQCHIQKHSPDFVLEKYWPKIAH
ncbi:MAG: cytochrome c family protein, partial [Gammaproteobacteria bacterium]|nr:cytochrome c family protein [Gammaproteobacteria bacterium]